MAVWGCASVWGCAARCAVIMHVLVRKFLHAEHNLSFTQRKTCWKLRGCRTRLSRDYANPGAVNQTSSCMVCFTRNEVLIHSLFVEDSNTWGFSLLRTATVKHTVTHPYLCRG